MPILWKYTYIGLSVSPTIILSGYFELHRDNYLYIKKKKRSCPSWDPKQHHVRDGAQRRVQRHIWYALRTVKDRAIEMATNSIINRCSFPTVSNVDRLIETSFTVCFFYKAQMFVVSG